jgi:hypothetical protein
MKRFIAFSVFVIVFGSLSAQLKKFTVDVPYMPNFKITDSIQSFTILNRSLSPDFENFIDDSLQLSFYRKNFKADKVLLDSLVADTTVKAIGEILFDSDRFDIVIPIERNIPRYLPYNQTPDTLTWKYAQSICNLYNTDALLVMENFAARAVTNYKRQRQFIHEGYYMVHSASIEIYYRTHWRLYDPKNESILVDVIDVDTLYWNADRLDVHLLFSELPSVKQALVQTGIFSAAKFSEMISPKWVSEKRYYYVLKNSGIDQSVNFAAQGDWERALENWLIYAETGSKSTRSKIMLNIALASEMLGDVDSAIVWLNRAQNNYYREITNHYLKQLITRQSIIRNKKKIKTS